jgi:hypothetical protein
MVPPKQTYQITFEICLDVVAESPAKALALFEEKFTTPFPHEINDRVRIWDQDGEEHSPYEEEETA